MKSLGTFKGIATRLKKQIVEAKNVIIECENKYNGNPCKRTLSALDAAERKFMELTVRLGYITETIEHYDFYKWCWEQEEEQAMGYADFNNHLS